MGQRGARIVSVFGSGTCAEGEAAYTMAYELGGALARAGFGVASGGYGGTMEAVSRGAREAGGNAIGIVAAQISSQPNRWINETIVVARWQDRLWRLIEMGNAYVVCPGGTGTLVELAVAWEMMCKGLLERRPLVVLGEFWSPVMKCVERGDAECRGFVLKAPTVGNAVEMVEAGAWEGQGRIDSGKGSGWI